MQENNMIRLRLLEPSNGVLSGGTRMIIHGKGFLPRPHSLQVRFQIPTIGVIVEVPVKFLNESEIECVTPNLKEEARRIISTISNLSASSAAVSSSPQLVQVLVDIVLDTQYFSNQETFLLHSEIILARISPYCVSMSPPTLLTATLNLLKMPSATSRIAMMQKDAIAKTGSTVFLQEISSLPVYIRFHHVSERTGATSQRIREAKWKISSSGVYEVEFEADLVEYGTTFVEVTLNRNDFFGGREKKPSKYAIHYMVHHEIQLESIFPPCICMTSGTHTNVTLCGDGFIDSGDILINLEQPVFQPQLQQQKLEKAERTKKIHKGSALSKTSRSSNTQDTKSSISNTMISLPEDDKTSTISQLSATFISSSQISVSVPPNLSFGLTNFHVSINGGRQFSKQKVTALFYRERALEKITPTFVSLKGASTLKIQHSILPVEEIDAFYRIAELTPPKKLRIRFSAMDSNGNNTQELVKVVFAKVCQHERGIISCKAPSFYEEYKTRRKKAMYALDNEETDMNVLDGGVVSFQVSVSLGGDEHFFGSLQLGYFDPIIIRSVSAHHGPSSGGTTVNILMKYKVPKSLSITVRFLSLTNIDEFECVQGSIMPLPTPNDIQFDEEEAFTSIAIAPYTIVCKTPRWTSLSSTLPLLTMIQVSYNDVEFFPPYENKSLSNQLATEEIPQTKQNSSTIEQQYRALEKDRSYLYFLYYNAPVVTSIAPTSADISGGSYVRITGQHIVDHGAPISVVFESPHMTRKVVGFIENDVLCCCVPPFHVGSATIYVSLNSEQYSKGKFRDEITHEDFNFVYYSSPSLTGINPQSASLSVSSHVKIYGINLIDTGSIKVRFGFYQVGNSGGPTSQAMQNGSTATESQSSPTVHIGRNSVNYKSPHTNQKNPPISEKLAKFLYPFQDVLGTAADGVITCDSPTFPSEKGDVHAFVDVALNGNDFSGTPLTMFYFRKYSIQMVEPAIGAFEIPIHLVIHLNQDIRSDSVHLRVLFVESSSHANDSLSENDTSAKQEKVDIYGPITIEKWNNKQIEFLFPSIGYFVHSLNTLLRVDLEISFDKTNFHAMGNLLEYYKVYNIPHLTKISPLFGDFSQETEISAHGLYINDKDHVEIIFTLEKNPSETDVSTEKATLNVPAKIDAKKQLITFKCPPLRTFGIDLREQRTHVAEKSQHLIQQSSTSHTSFSGSLAQKRSFKCSGTNPMFENVTTGYGNTSMPILSPTRNRHMLLEEMLSMQISIISGQIKALPFVFRYYRPPKLISMTPCVGHVCSGALVVLEFEEPIETPTVAVRFGKASVRATITDMRFVECYSPQLDEGAHEVAVSFNQQFYEPAVIHRSNSDSNIEIEQLKFRACALPIFEVPPNQNLLYGFGPLTGGTNLIIKGKGFISEAKIYVQFASTTKNGFFQGSEGVIEAKFIDEETISCISPPAAKAERVTIRVSYNRQQYFESGSSFEYHEPTVFSCKSTLCGPVNGGTPLVISIQNPDSGLPQNKSMINCAVRFKSEKGCIRDVIAPYYAEEEEIEVLTPSWPSNETNEIVSVEISMVNSYLLWIPWDAQLYEEVLMDEERAEEKNNLDKIEEETNWCRQFVGSEIKFLFYDPPEGVVRIEPVAGPVQGGTEVLAYCGKIVDIGEISVCFTMQVPTKRSTTASVAAIIQKEQFPIFGSSSDRLLAGDIISGVTSVARPGTRRRSSISSMPNAINTQNVLVKGKIVGEAVSFIAPKVDSPCMATIHIFLNGINYTCTQAHQLTFYYYQEPIIRKIFPLYATVEAPFTITVVGESIRDYGSKIVVRFKRQNTEYFLDVDGWFVKDTTQQITTTVIDVVYGAVQCTINNLQPGYYEVEISLNGQHFTASKYVQTRYGNYNGTTTTTLLPFYSFSTPFFLATPTGLATGGSSVVLCLSKRLAKILAKEARCIIQFCPSGKNWNENNPPTSASMAQKAATSSHYFSEPVNMPAEIDHGSGRVTCRAPAFPSACVADIDILLPINSINSLVLNFSNSNHNTQEKSPIPSTGSTCRSSNEDTDMGSGFVPVNLLSAASQGTTTNAISSTAIFSVKEREKYFSFESPSISTMTPTCGPISGGTCVVIGGSNLIDTGQICVRFRLSFYEREFAIVPGTYSTTYPDGTTSENPLIICRTPIVEISDSKNPTSNPQATSTTSSVLDIINPSKTKNDFSGLTKTRVSNVSRIAEQRDVQTQTAFSSTSSGSYGSGASCSIANSTNSTNTNGKSPNTTSQPAITLRLNRYAMRNNPRFIDFRTFSVLVDISLNGGEHFIAHSVTFQYYVEFDPRDVRWLPRHLPTKNLDKTAPIDGSKSRANNSTSTNVNVHSSRTLRVQMPKSYCFNDNLDRMSFHFEGIPRPIFDCKGSSVTLHELDIAKELFSINNEAKSKNENQGSVHGRQNSMAFNPGTRERSYNTGEHSDVTSPKPTTNQPKLLGDEKSYVARPDSSTRSKITPYIAARLIRPNEVGCVVPEFTSTGIVHVYFSLNSQNFIDLGELYIHSPLIIEEEANFRFCSNIGGNFFCMRSSFSNVLNHLPTSEALLQAKEESRQLSYAHRARHSAALNGGRVNTAVSVGSTNSHFHQISSKDLEEARKDSFVATNGLPVVDISRQDNRSSSIISNNEVIQAASTETDDYFIPAINIQDTKKNDIEFLPREPPLRLRSEQMHSQEERMDSMFSQKLLNIWRKREFCTMRVHILPGSSGSRLIKKVIVTISPMDSSIEIARAVPDENGFCKFEVTDWNEEMHVTASIPSLTTFSLFSYIIKKADVVSQSMESIQTSSSLPNGSNEPTSPQMDIILFQLPTKPCIQTYLFGQVDLMEVLTVHILNKDGKILNGIDGVYSNPLSNCSSREIPSSYGFLLTTLLSTITEDAVYICIELLDLEATFQEHSVPKSSLKLQLALVDMHGICSHFMGQIHDEPNGTVWVAFEVQLKIDSTQIWPLDRLIKSTKEIRKEITRILQTRRQQQMPIQTLSFSSTSGNIMASVKEQKKNWNDFSLFGTSATGGGSNCQKNTNQKHIVTTRVHFTPILENGEIATSMATMGTLAQVVFYKQQEQKGEIVSSQDEKSGMWKTLQRPDIVRVECILPMLSFTGPMLVWVSLDGICFSNQLRLTAYDPRRWKIASLEPCYSLVGQKMPLRIRGQVPFIENGKILVRFSDATRYMDVSAKVEDIRLMTIKVLQVKNLKCLLNHPSLRNLHVSLRLDIWPLDQEQQHVVTGKTTSSKDLTFQFVHGDQLTFDEEFQFKIFLQKTKFRLVLQFFDSNFTTRHVSSSKSTGHTNISHVPCLMSSSVFELATQFLSLESDCFVTQEQAICHKVVVSMNTILRQASCSFVTSSGFSMDDMSDIEAEILLKSTKQTLLQEYVVCDSPVFEETLKLQVQISSGDGFFNKEDNSMNSTILQVHEAPIVEATYPHILPRSTGGEFFICGRGFVPSSRIQLRLFCVPMHMVGSSVIDSEKQLLEKINSTNELYDDKSLWFIRLLEAEFISSTELKCRLPSMVASYQMYYQISFDALSFTPASRRSKILLFSVDSVDPKGGPSSGKTFAMLRGTNINACMTDVLDGTSSETVLPIVRVSFIRNNKELESVCVPGEFYPPEDAIYCYTPQSEFGLQNTSVVFELCLCIKETVPVPTSAIKSNISNCRRLIPDPAAIAAAAVISERGYAPVDITGLGSLLFSRDTIQFVMYKTPVIKSVTPTSGLICGMSSVELLIKGLDEKMLPTMKSAHKVRFKRHGQMQISEAHIMSDGKLFCIVPRFNVLNASARLIMHSSMVFNTLSARQNNDLNNSSTQANSGSHGSSTIPSYASAMKLWTRDSGMHVTILRAKHLQVWKKNACNPFIVIKWGCHQLKSTRKDGTFTPTWNEHFDFEASPNTADSAETSLRITVENQFSAEQSELLGHVELLFSNLNSEPFSFRAWFPLHKFIRNQNNTTSVLLSNTAGNQNVNGNMTESSTIKGGEIEIVISYIPPPIDQAFQANGTKTSKKFSSHLKKHLESVVAAQKKAISHTVNEDRNRKQQEKIIRAFRATHPVPISPNELIIELALNGQDFWSIAPQKCFIAPTPLIFSVEPTFISLNGGTPMTVTGVNFFPSNLIRVAYVLKLNNTLPNEESQILVVEGKYRSSTSISCVTPSFKELGGTEKALVLIYLSMNGSDFDSITLPTKLMNIPMTSSASSSGNHLALATEAEAVAIATSNLKGSPIEQSIQSSDLSTSPSLAINNTTSEQGIQLLASEKYAIDVQRLAQKLNTTGSGALPQSAFLYLAPIFKSFRHADGVFTTKLILEGDFFTDTNCAIAKFTSKLNEKDQRTTKVIVVNSTTLEVTTPDFPTGTIVTIAIAMNGLEFWPCPGELKVYQRPRILEIHPKWLCATSRKLDFVIRGVNFSETGAIQVSFKLGSSKKIVEGVCSHGEIRCCVPIQLIEEDEEEKKKDVVEEEEEKKNDADAAAVVADDDERDVDEEENEFPRDTFDDKQESNKEAKRLEKARNQPQEILKAFEVDVRLEKVHHSFTGFPMQMNIYRLTPVITGVSPMNGPIYGGFPLNIEGKNFLNTGEIVVRFQLLQENQEDLTTAQSSSSDTAASSTTSNTTSSATAIAYGVASNNHQSNTTLLNDNQEIGGTTTLGHTGAFDPVFVHVEATFISSEKISCIVPRFPHEGIFAIQVSLNRVEFSKINLNTWFLVWQNWQKRKRLIAQSAIFGNDPIAFEEAFGTIIGNIEGIDNETFEEKDMKDLRRKSTFMRPRFNFNEVKSLRKLPNISMQKISKRHILTVEKEEEEQDPMLLFNKRKEILRWCERVENSEGINDSDTIISLRHQSQAIVLKIDKLLVTNHADITGRMVDMFKLQCEISLYRTHASSIAAAALTANLTMETMKLNKQQLMEGIQWIFPHSTNEDLQQVWDRVNPLNSGTITCEAFLKHLLKPRTTSLGPGYYNPKEQFIRKRTSVVLISPPVASGASRKIIEVQSPTTFSSASVGALTPVRGLSSALSTVLEKQITGPVTEAKNYDAVDPTKPRVKGGVLPKRKFWYDPLPKEAALTASPPPKVFTDSQEELGTSSQLRGSRSPSTSIRIMGRKQEPRMAHKSSTKELLPRESVANLSLGHRLSISTGSSGPVPAAGEDSVTNLLSAANTARRNILYNGMLPLYAKFLNSTEVQRVTSSQNMIPNQFVIPTGATGVATSTNSTKSGLLAAASSLLKFSPKRPPPKASSPTPGPVMATVIEKRENSSSSKAD